jgi:hypothetical protein
MKRREQSTSGCNLYPYRSSLYQSNYLHPPFLKKKLSFTTFFLDMREYKIKYIYIILYLEKFTVVEKWAIIPVDTGL